MKLIVCLEGEVAGVLQGDGTRASFTYAPEWLQSPGAYPLSQSLPTTPTVYTGRWAGGPGAGAGGGWDARPRPAGAPRGPPPPPPPAPAPRRGRHRTQKL